MITKNYIVTKKIHHRIIQILIHKQKKNNKTNQKNISPEKIQ